MRAGDQKLRYDLEWPYIKVLQGAYGTLYSSPAGTNSNISGAIYIISNLYACALIMADSYIHGTWKHCDSCAVII